MGGNRKHESRGVLNIRRVGNVLFGADRQVAQWVVRRIPGFILPDEPRALGVVVNGKMVAGVVYERWNGVHVEVSIAVDDSATWASKATLATLFRYPFITLNCKAISVVVPMSNLASLGLATKLGFEPEAIVRYAAHDGSSLVILKMLRETCKWIADNGQRKRTDPT